MARTKGVLTLLESVFVTLNQYWICPKIKEKYYIKLSRMNCSSSKSEKILYKC